MRQYPDCVNRRYQALDDLVQELGAVVSNHSGEVGDEASTDPGIKLMCKFWNILKEDPDCNLPHVVQQRMELNARSSFFKPQKITCYATSQDGHEAPEKMKATSSSCSGGSGSPSPRPHGCCSGKSSPRPTREGCGSGKTSDSERAPLNKALCNLKQAAAVDKNCSAKISELKTIQKQVAEQVAVLEEREQEGIKKMKEAEHMWQHMEEDYKQKIAESIERQKELMNEKSEIESHVAKWRRSKKELEEQMKHLEKCEKDIKEKLNRKNNDLRAIKGEISDLQKRVDTNADDLEAAKTATAERKRAATHKMEKIGEELQRIQEKIKSEMKLKQQKEEEGHQYIKEARDDLQNICRILLQKRLENEDLKVEIDAVVGEVELLKKTTDQCKDKCKNKENSLSAALKQIQNEIAAFKVRCTRCHVCVDTQDNRRFCTDCIKCHEERECIYKDGKCTEDPNNDCICMSVKKKFLDNVFENMFTVLDRQSKTGAGKALAEEVLACLRNSTNGKLNDATRKALQEFVLVTVKKNLNLTIIGGAVKTRCEMDPETYKTLMNCLNKLTVTPPEKKDASVPARKEPCKRWGSGECNCPSGPKFCICTRKAPPPSSDRTPFPQLPEDKEDIGEAPTCPHMDKVTCGPDCGNIAPSDAVKKLAQSFNPQTCSEKSCTFSKNMRAAQCMLGQDSLNTLTQSKGYMTNPSFVPNLSRSMGHKVGTPFLPNADKLKGYTTKTPFMPDFDEEVACSCGCGLERSCSCYADNSTNTRGKIIDEVMGRYAEVTAIEKNKEKQCSKRCRRNINGKQTKCAGNVTGNIKEYKTNQRKQYIRKKEYNNLRVTVTDHRIKETFEKFTQNENESFSKAVKRDETQDVKRNEEINDEPANGSEIRLDQTVVLSKATRDCATEPYITISKTNFNPISLQHQIDDLTEEEPPKDLFKVALSNDNGEVDQEFTELTTTSSGSIQMALDEKMIADLDSKTKDNPNLNVALKKTISGHFILEFKKCDCNSTESRRVVVRRTETGNIILEVNKDLINIIQPNAMKCTDTNQNKLYSSIGIKKPKRMPRYNKQNLNEKEANSTAIAAIIKNKMDQEKENSVSENDASNNIKKSDTFTSAIREKRGGDRYHDIPKPKPNNLKKQEDNIEQERVLIKVVSNCTNTNETDLRKLRQCLRKMDKDIKKVENEKKINITEIQQFLTLTGEFKKMFDRKRTSIDVTVVGENGVESDINTRLIKTSSGQITVDANKIINDGKIASRLREYPILFVKRNSKYLLKFGECDTTTNAVLRRSSSCGEAHVVLQNPYTKLDMRKAPLKPKKEFIRVMVKYIDHPDPIPTSVMKMTNSGNYVFVLDKEEFEHLYLQTIKKNVSDDQKCNVSLSKTQSDCFVIDFDRKPNIVNNALLVKSDSGNIKLLMQGHAFDAIHKSMETIPKSSTVFEELFKEMPPSSSKFHRENLSNSKYLETKSFSDSRLLDNMTQNQNSLLEMPSAVLKKTASGQYAVVLNKEYKPIFIKKLKNQISSSGQAFVPIVKTDQGDIIISLNRDHKSLYGTVKITPSGNIYVSVDENVIKQLEKDTISMNEVKNVSEQSSQSVYMIGMITSPQNKERSPTSHPHPESYDFDDGKCNFKDLQSLGSNWTYSQTEEHARNQTFACNQVQVEKDSSPFSVLRKQTDEQCFFIIDTNNKPNGDQSETSFEPTTGLSSNGHVLSDLIESEPVQDTSYENEQSYESDSQRHDMSSLDYLESLPPQLPMFLREF